MLTHLHLLHHHHHHRQRYPLCTSSPFSPPQHLNASLLLAFRLPLHQRIGAARKRRDCSSSYIRMFTLLTPVVTFYTFVPRFLHSVDVHCSRAFNFRNEDHPLSARRRRFIHKIRLEIFLHKFFVENIECLDCKCRRVTIPRPS